MSSGEGYSWFLSVLGDEFIEGVGEFFAVTGAEVFGATGFYAIIAQGAHEIAHIRYFTDVIFVVERAAGVESQCVFFDYAQGEGDVGGDDEVSCFAVCGDFIIGDVCAFAHLYEGYVVGVWYGEALIGHKGYGGFCAIGSAE